MPLRRATIKGIANSSLLRKELTLPERRLWNQLKFLREDGFHFRRQHALGGYIVDFCEVKKRLVIELDGSQHLDQKEYDLERTEFLQSWGYQVLRFWNNEVSNDLDGIMVRILDELGKE